MHTVRLTLALLLLFGPRSALRAQPDEGSEADDIPVVGQPSDLPFSDASGRFEVNTHVEPTTVEAETPLTFTLKVRAIGNVRRPPKPLDLRQLPAFKKSFLFKGPPDDTRRPDDQTWEFIYRLKPCHIDVSEVPSFPFVFFNPEIRFGSKGFQVIYTDPIRLHVLVHETVPVPVQAPESAFVLATGADVLVRQTSWTPPGVAVSVLLLFMPPILCAGWYLSWRRLYPDAARQAMQRRSRAARQALPMLDAARRLDPEQSASRTVTIVAGYLRERLDLAVAEPTPHEVALLFEQWRCSPSLIEQAVRFFEACDSVRFLPVSTLQKPDLPDSAIQLILAVEAETCPAEPS